MKILVAYNGTKESSLHWNLPRRTPRYFDAETSARIIQRRGQRGRSGRNQQDRASELEQIKTELKQEGIDCEVNQLARGLSPGEDIVIFAEENNVDMIYVGIQKKSRTSKLMLGSTAQYIILKALARSFRSNNNIAARCYLTRLRRYFT